MTGALWMAPQVPISPPPPGPNYTHTPRRRDIDLVGPFRLRTSNFLQWRPGTRPIFGAVVVPQQVYTLSLEISRGPLEGLSARVETSVPLETEEIRGTHFVGLSWQSPDKPLGVRLQRSPRARRQLPSLSLVGAF